MGEVRHDTSATERFTPREQAILGLIELGVSRHPDVSAIVDDPDTGMIKCVDPESEFFGSLMSFRLGGTQDYRVELRPIFENTAAVRPAFLGYRVEGVSPE